MRRTRKETIALAARFLVDYGTLDLRGRPASPAEWLMLKLGCSQQEAERLVEAVTNANGNGDRS